MIRWIRNIFIAVVIAVAIVWTIAVIAYNDSSLAATAILFLLGVMLSIVLWALGLTRLSTAKVRERSIAILNYLEQSVRLNLPLTRMLLAAEASEPWWIAGRIGKLRKKLDQGSSIAAALRKAVPGTSRRSLALIGAAERLGRVGPELSQLVRHERELRNRNLAERSFLRSYPVAMTIVIVIILTLVMVFVIPKYIQIFKDFKIPLPPLTLDVIQFTNFFGPAGWMVLAIAAAAATSVAQQLRQRVGWLNPGNWFTSSRDLGDVCHLISEGLQAGQPMPTAIRGATDLAINRWLRSKLHKWADGIEAGMSSVDAAYAADLPRLIAGLTVTAEGFEFLAKYYAGKFNRLMTLLRAAAIPAMVFFFGIIVAIVALTLFLPMVQLIDSVGSRTRVL